MTAAAPAEASGPAPGPAPALTWPVLRTAALVGTDRRQLPPTGSVAGHATGEPAPAQGAPPPEAESAPAARLLRAAALVRAQREAGAVAARARPATAAGSDPRPPAPPRASQLLGLAMGGEGAPATDAGAVLRWCGACRDAGARVDHAQLVELLELATRRRELRDGVRGVLGERGRWLAAQEPRWRWAGPVAVGGAVAAGGAATAGEAAAGDAAAGDAPAGDAAAGGQRLDEAAWALLPARDRGPALREVRVADPAAGRRLVEATWATDPAQARRAGLDALATGLGPADEELLERALDDRAASVRASAARLLDGLPGSARAARCAERLRPLVSVSGGSAGRRRRRTVVVQLPGDLDAGALRDGLDAPPRGRSRRSHQLARLVAAAPLALWPETTGLGPEELLALQAEPSELPELWQRAAIAQRDAEWAGALVRRRPEGDLLDVLLDGPREDAGAPGTRTSGSASSSVAVVAGLRAHARSAERPDPAIAGLAAATPRLHPAAVPELERWLADLERGDRWWLRQADATDRLRHAVQSALARLSVHRAILAAFDPTTPGPTTEES